MAPAPSSATMAMAVKIKRCPALVRGAVPHRNRLSRSIATRLTYELGVEIWRTLVDESVDGVMMPRPGSSGKSG